MEATKKILNEDSQKKVRKKSQHASKKNQHNTKEASKRIKD